MYRTSPNLRTADRPLRIAVIGGRGVPSNYSGVERICEELFTWFAQRGHKITIYCRPSVLAESQAEYRGMRLVRTPAPGGKNGETLSHSLTSLLHAVNYGDDGVPFDLISMHTIAPNLFAPIARIANIPVVSHVHGLDHLREKWRGLGSKVIGMAERVMVKTASQIVAVNPAIAKHYQTTFGLEAMLLPNGVHRTDDSFSIDTSVLDRFALRQGNYIVSVGRLVPEKRIHDTIAAFKKIKTDHKLVFVGDAKHTPEYFEELKQLAADDSRVVFTGLQTGDALETLFRSAAFYVSASELEGNPSSVLECMERGTPAVLSDIDGHRPLCQAVNGYDLCFTHGDVMALTEKIQYALDNPNHLADLATRCRQHVRQVFAWPVLAARTEALYCETFLRHSQNHVHLPEAV